MFRHDNYAGSLFIHVPLLISLVARFNSPACPFFLLLLLLFSLLSSFSSSSRSGNVVIYQVRNLITRCAVSGVLDAQIFSSAVSAGPRKKRRKKHPSAPDSSVTIASINRNPLRSFGEGGGGAFCPRVVGRLRTADRPARYLEFPKRHTTFIYFPRPPCTE